jgi:hypothetical protein
MRKLQLLTIIILLFSCSIWAQTEQQSRQLARTVDKQALATVADNAEQNRVRAFEYAQEHNKPLIIKRENSPNSYLSGISETNVLFYTKVYNREAANTTNTPALYPAGGLGQFIEGNGMTIGIWDGGKVLNSHEIFDATDKVTQIDNPSEADDHATHVAGTLAGIKLTNASDDAEEARGMAYKAKIKAWDFFGDIPEMAENQANGGVLVSNHSYGLDADNFSNNNPFGAYNNTSASVDAITYNAPFYLVVVAAGNVRGDFNVGKGGYDLLTDLAAAKNTLTVAAVNEVPEYNGPSSVLMSDFSSWGPTDDRRIKPDISGQGVQVLSSVAHDVGFNNEGNIVTDNYQNYNGTSMASPNVAGSLLLLQELGSDLNDGQFLKSATLKAIAIHTARETGDNIGPDPRFGWGLLNTGAGAQLMIEDNGAEENTKSYQEVSLDEGGSFIQSVTAQGGDTPVKVTIVWTDPSGSTQSSDELDDTTPRLVNDLDLTLAGDGILKETPWKIDGPESTDVTQGNNSVDNVEQVYVDDAAEGEVFEIEVTHKANLQSGSQDFSIVISGVQNADPAASTENVKLKGFSLYPNPADAEFHLTLGQSSGDVDVAIYDLQGRQVMTKQFQGTSNFDQMVNIQSLSKGVYFVKVKANGTQGTRKLIVK